MEVIVEGARLLLQPEPMLYMVVGLIIGFLVGVLPGFDAANGAALLLAFSIALSTESALILMATIYVGAQVAGAIPAILMNVPGTGGAAATALDGYPMARQGKGTLAIAVGRAASSMGGVLAAVVVIFLIAPISSVALKFQSPETFLVAVVGIMVIGTVSDGAPIKGLLSGFMGLLISSMSASVESGSPRFNFGFLELYSEVPFVPVTIGVFGISQMLVFAAESRHGSTIVPFRPDGDTALARFRNGFRREVLDTREGIRITVRRPLNVLRSSSIGLLIGSIPGLGPAVGNFVSYGEAKRASKEPERFGKGHPDGIIASEACDNAVAAGTLIPTLTLGIPGSATAAIMLAALYLHGVQPGPRVMETHGPEVFAVLIAVALASVLLLPLGFILAAPLVYVTRMPSQYLIPGVLVISMVGAFALRSSVFDMGLMLIFGLLGFVMRLTGYPVVPLVLGVILGPIMEANLMRALQLSRNSPLIFLESWPSRVLVVMIASLFLWTIYTAITGRQTRTEEAARASVANAMDGDS